MSDRWFLFVCRVWIRRNPKVMTTAIPLMNEPIAARSENAMMPPPRMSLNKAHGRGRMVDLTGGAECPLWVHRRRRREDAAERCGRRLERVATCADRQMPVHSRLLSGDPWTSSQVRRAANSARSLSASRSEEHTSQL